MVGKTEFRRDNKKMVLNIFILRITKDKIFWIANVFKRYNTWKKNPVLICARLYPFTDGRDTFADR